VAGKRGEGIRRDVAGVEAGLNNQVVNVRRTRSEMWNCRFENVGGGANLVLRQGLEGLRDGS